MGRTVMGQEVEREGKHREERCAVGPASVTGQVYDSLVAKTGKRKRER
ncbi:MAG: hypothetical protein ACOC58_04940 [Chloroflexota bacterium]